MKENTVVGDDLTRKFSLTVTFLRITTAKEFGRNHRLDTGGIKHGENGGSHLREKPFVAAAREVKDGLGVAAFFFTDDGNRGRIREL